VRLVKEKVHVEEFDIASMDYAVSARGRRVPRVLPKAPDGTEISEKSDRDDANARRHAAIFSCRSGLHRHDRRSGLHVYSVEGLTGLGGRLLLGRLGDRFGAKPVLIARLGHFFRYPKQGTCRGSSAQWCAPQIQQMPSCYGVPAWCSISMESPNS
jgi:hypothetical protein